ncbi:MAG TPA: secondary thiamine-phosphate synthase enzyme YjbQ, partial [Anaerolineae bacterium]|nr:secondary thiamine-phosphate synthase enzyme YjbQ [Anaerolineae bacterium]
MSFHVSTSERVQLKDITIEVASEVQESGIRDGIALVYVPHATAAVLINENERGLVSDLTWMVRQVVPWDRPYEHDKIDDNAAAHLTSAALGCTLTLPITGGQLERGTWQNIFLVELDGPRQRR